MKFKLQKGYMGNLVIGEKFVRDAMPQISDLAVRAYLLICMNCHNKCEDELSKVAQLLGLDTDGLIKVLSELEEKELIKVSASSITLQALAREEALGIAHPREYTPEEINSLDDKDIRELIRSAEKSFGKLLSHAEVNSIIGLYNWLGLPVEVLAVLLDYAVSIGKKSMGYIEKIAIEWAELEIDSAKKAHEHIGEIERKKSELERVKALFGIYGRNLTKKEKEYAEEWTKSYTDDEILSAYEKTIDATGKISFAYTDKVLKSGGEEKPQTAKSGAKREVKPSKFNNFTQAPSDFEAIERAALKKLMKLTGRDKKDGIS